MTSDAGPCANSSIMYDGYAMRVPMKNTNGLPLSTSCMPNNSSKMPTILTNPALIYLLLTTMLALPDTGSAQEEGITLTFFHLLSGFNSHINFPIFYSCFL